MPRTRSKLLTATAIALALVSGFGPAGLASGAVAATTCGTSWSIVPSAPQVKDPRSIAVISSDDVWIVGAQTAGAAKVHPAAEHWDGSAWTLYSPPYVGLGENSLNGVSATAADDVWAVGYSQPQKKTDSAFQTLVEHWDGSTWSVVPSPSVGTNSNTLTSVAAVSPTDVWAAGYYFDGNTRTTLMEHYDGTSWTVVPSPDPGSESNSLLGLTAVSSSNVWAVGFTNDGNGYNALIEHYDGASWTAKTAPADPGSPEDVLAGISSDGASDVYAFGYHIVGTKYETLVEHFDGSGWAIEPSADGTDDDVTVLRAGSALPGDVWSVGLDYRASDGRYEAFSEHYDGTSWKPFPMAIAQTKDKSEMYAVAHVPGSAQVWASGRSNDVETICPASGLPASVRSSAAPASAPLAGVQGFHTTPGQPGRIPGVVKPATPGTARPASAIAVAAKDMAKPAGIYEVVLTHGAVVADFNNDGLPDIFLGRHQNPAKLYLNNGDGTFRLVDFGEFPHRDRHGCTAGDVNHDGLLDIFCNTGSDRGTEAKRDELYVQQSDGTFVDEAAQYGVLQPFDRGRLSAFMDANHDGYPDVFAANFPDRADGMPSSNRLFLDHGGSSLQLAPGSGLDQEIDAASISVGDVNNDGYQDLLLTTEAGIKLYRNDSGTGFTDVTKQVGLNHKASYAIFTDFNDDGLLDVVEVNPARLQVDIQQSDGTFKPCCQETLTSGFALAAGDVNADGYPDIYVMQGATSTNKNVPDEVFLNNGSGTGFDPTPISVPQPPVPGDAEAVTPIDYDGNGLMDFLVQNGNATKPGSIQLIAFFPASSSTTALNRSSARR